MICIICDSCKKSIPGPRRDVSYMTLLNKDLCPDCSGKLEKGVGVLMAREDKYSSEVYNSHRTTLLMKMTR